MKRFAVIFGLVCLLPCVFAQSNKTAMSDLQELAVVKLSKREAITLRQVKMRVETYQKQRNGQAITVDDRQKILDAMIQEKLITQAAQRAGVAVSDSDVDQYFLQMMSQMAGVNVTEQELTKQIREQLGMSLDDYMRDQTGMSLADYKAYLKTQLLAQRYVVSQRQNEIQNVAATDEEIRAFYELNKSNFVQNDMVRMFVVIVPKENNSKAQSRANEILNSYKDKKQTADQLIVQSRRDNSDFQAGEILVGKTEQHAIQMGFSYQQLLQLFTRNVGFTSDLIDNPQSYQFYSVLQKYDAKMLGLSDVVQPGTTVTVYDYIRQNLSQQNQMQYLQTAVEDIAKSLDTAENVERKKTGKDLISALSW